MTLSTSNRIGLACSLILKCAHCDLKASKPNSPTTDGTVDNTVKPIFDINVRYVYALRSVGLEQETGEVLAGLLNLPKQSKFALYNKVLLGAAKRVCTESMKNVVETVVRQNEGSRDISAAFDGSWQRREAQVEEWRWLEPAICSCAP